MVDYNKLKLRLDRTYRIVRCIIISDAVTIDDSSCLLTLKKIQRQRIHQDPE